MLFLLTPLYALAQLELEDRNGDDEVRILAFGDSITFGVGDGVSSGEIVDEAPIIPGVLGYPGRVESNLGVFVDNRGVPGELLTDGGISRFAGELGRNRADYVLILEGANDAIFQISPTNYRVKLQAMVNIARTVNVEPIILTVLPTCCDRSGPIPFLQAYASEARDVGATNDVLVVDTEVAFREGCPSLSSCTLLNRPEGLHPNTEGYDLIGTVVSEAILGEPLEEASPTPTATPMIEMGGDSDV